jgi:hypothetical protein
VCNVSIFQILGEHVFIPYSKEHKMYSFKPTSQVKKCHQALGSKIKTDSIAATAIASILKAKNYDAPCISYEKVLELRELV